MTHLPTLTVALSLTCFVTAIFGHEQTRKPLFIKHLTWSASGVLAMLMIWISGVEQPLWIQSSMLILVIAGVGWFLSDLKANKRIRSNEEWQS